MHTFFSVLLLCVGLNAAAGQAGLGAQPRGDGIVAASAHEPAHAMPVQQQVAPAQLPHPLNVRASEGDGLVRSANAGTMIATLAPVQAVPAAPPPQQASSTVHGTHLVLLGIVLMLGIALRRLGTSAR